MTHWVGSISFEQRDNWEICKRTSLFGSNTPTALGVREGDELFIWGSQRGWLARCRVTADARRPGGVDDVPWPDPERYIALIPIEVLGEPEVPLAMSGSEIERTLGIGTIQLPRFPRLDAQHAERLTVLLSDGYRSHGQLNAVAPAQPSATDHPLLQALDDLKVDRQLGRPAPYQQLVLLWAIAEAVLGGDRLRSFSSAGDELRVLLAPFAVGESAPDPELPWFALRRSPWWQLSPEPDGPVTRGGMDFVRREDPVAGLTREVHRLVREDSAFRQRAIEKLTAPLAGHAALQAAMASLFSAPAPEQVVDGEAAAVLTQLVGRRLTTVTGQVNRVLRVEPPVVIVATERSPQGQPVPVSDLQRALDLLRRDGAVTIDVPTLGHRGSFLGAVLATRPGVTISGSPPVASSSAAAQPEPTDVPGDVTVEDVPGSGSYEVGRIYDRDNLHEAARRAGLPYGNRYSGITVVGEHLCIFWNPFKRLYANRWIEEPREFTYSGEGSSGDQTETGGNLRLIEHEDSAEPVMLFVKTKREGSAWVHMGGYRVAEHTWGTSHGDDGVVRRDLRFRFALVTPRASRPVSTPRLPPVAPPRLPTEQELWDAIQRGAAAAGERRRGAKTHVDKRLSDPLKTDYVVQRAIESGGACELCEVPAGWVREDGRPHFQAHHIDADIDLVDWIAALCGTCHDRMHHSTDRQQVAQRLLAKIQMRQRKRGRPVVNREGLSQRREDTPIPS
ncbi:hypothetical protein ACI789_02535 [Geodermatophilus sp. SYSU D00965]